MPAKEGLGRHGRRSGVRTSVHLCCRGTAPSGGCRAGTDEIPGFSRERVKTEETG